MEFIEFSSGLSLSHFKDKLKCLGIDLANSVWPALPSNSASIVLSINSSCILVVAVVDELLFVVVVLVVLRTVFVTVCPPVLFVEDDTAEEVCVWVTLPDFALELPFDLSIGGNEAMDEDEEDDDGGITLRSMSRHRFVNSSSALPLYFSSSCNKQSLVLFAASSMRIFLWLSGAFWGTSRLSSVMRNLVRLHLSIHGG